MAVHEDLLSIGKMSEMNRVTVATLRLYDELGLLHPGL
jgi:DNA-binding transcriptional MerR regulator